MPPNWAEENLAVIRTLMERAALYRRALAPVMLAVGALGTVAGGLFLFGIGTGLHFHHRWPVLAVVGFAIALLIARLQALKAGEPLLTPPARKITGAFFLPWACAGLMTLCLLPVGSKEDSHAWLNWILVSLWLVFYGCGLHAAAPFLVRGISRLAWGCALSGLGIFVGLLAEARFLVVYSPDLVMGATFGGFHLVAGIYLYFTEKKEPLA